MFGSGGGGRKETWGMTNTVMAQLVVLAAISPSEVPQLCGEKLTLTMPPLNQYIIVIIIVPVSFVDTADTSRKEWINIWMNGGEVPPLQVQHFQQKVTLIPGMSNGGGGLRGDESA